MGIRGFYRDKVSPIFNFIASSVLFVGGWYIEIFSSSSIGSAYWMIGLIGYYFTYRSFVRSSYFESD